MAKKKRRLSIVGYVVEQAEWEKSVIWTLKKLDIWFLFHRCRALILKFVLDYVC